jgi:hypothetical protein
MKRGKEGDTIKARRSKPIGRRAAGWMVFEGRYILIECFE